MNIFHMWYIAKNELKIVIRDIPGLVFLFITPLAVIVLASYALPSSSAQSAFTIPIVSQDDGYYARILIDQLSQLTSIKLEQSYVENGKHYPMTLAKAKQLIPDRKAAVIIPPEFTYDVNNGRQAAITIISDPADRTVPDIIQEILTQSIAQFNDKQIGMTVSTQSMKLVNDELTPKHVYLDAEPVIQAAGTLTDELISHPQIKVENEIYRSSSAHKTTPFDANLPGYAVMFVLMGTTFTAISLISEREEGTLRRLQVAPLSKASLLGGKLLGYFIQGNAQMAVLFAVGHFVFGMWLGTSILALTALIISLSFAATGLGIFFAALCRTQTQARGIALLVVLLSSALGGSWWPLYIEPQALQSASHVTLTAWAMDGFNNLIVYGRGLADIGTSLFALNAMGLLFFIIALAKLASQECL